MSGIMIGIVIRTMIMDNDNNNDKDSDNDKWLMIKD